MSKIIAVIETNHPIFGNIKLKEFPVDRNRFLCHIQDNLFSFSGKEIPIINKPEILLSPNYDLPVIFIELPYNP